MSEALIFASTNQQYDDRLFIELQVQYMKIPSSNLGRICCVQKLFLTFRTIFVHNMFSPCSAKRRASDKDLPVLRLKSWRIRELFGRLNGNKNTLWDLATFNSKKAFIYSIYFQHFLYERWGVWISHSVGYGTTKR